MLNSSQLSVRALSGLNSAQRWAHEPIFVVMQVDLVCHLFAIVPLILVWIRHGLKTSGG